MIENFSEYEYYQMYNDYNGFIIDFRMTIYNDIEYIAIWKDFKDICRLSIYDFSYLELSGDESLILSDDEWNLAKNIISEKWTDARNYAYDVYHNSGYFEGHPKRNLILPEKLNIPIQNPTSDI